MTGKSNLGLPAPFENNYFRERALKAANRQKQWYILVSGTKPEKGYGLPCRDLPAVKSCKVLNPVGFSAGTSSN